MYVCMYVCMYACMYVCMYAWMYVSMFVFLKVRSCCCSRTNFLLLSYLPHTHTHRSSDVVYGVASNPVNGQYVTVGDKHVHFWDLKVCSHLIGPCPVSHITSNRRKEESTCWQRRLVSLAYVCACEHTYIQA